MCPPKDNDVNDCPAESSRSFWDRLWTGPRYVDVGGQRYPIVAGAVPDVVPGGGVARLGFRSFRAFKAVEGPAGAGRHWHHIVGQTAGNVERFSAEATHSADNLIAIDAATHAKISGFYNSKAPIAGGLRVREWLAGQSFEAQREFGLQVLRTFGVIR